MAQGLLGAPFTFTESVMFLLRDFIEFCDGFFDDVIIFSETIEEHLIHLEKVLNKLAEYGTFINIEKCQFATNSVNFLGHNITTRVFCQLFKTCRKFQTSPCRKTQVIYVHS